MAGFFTQNRLNEIREKALLENASSMHGLYEYKFRKDKAGLKWLFVKNTDEFDRKFKLKFPNVDDSEIKNFIRIYLQPKLDENNYDLGYLTFWDSDGDEWQN